MVKPKLKVVQFSVYWINLSRTIGSEIQKTRPCVVISPDRMNHHLNTVIIAPMTSKGFYFPSRVNVRFDDKDGFILLDQIRAVDKSRLGKGMGIITDSDKKNVITVLRDMFDE